MTALMRLIPVLWLLSFFSAANVNAAIPEISNEHLQQLSSSAIWHRLLHYEPNFRQTRWISQVDDADFFLSANGKTNPADELKASLNGFYTQVSEPNAHPVCRFPSRWQYLKEALQLPPAPISVRECPEFNQWLDTLKPNSVTLVFASSYLNSPSSMFGHTLFRIDPANVDSGSKWLSYAVNFGAELNAEDNSLLYAYKGLFGGYPGFFSIIRYYEKIKEYGRIENRDLWEYNLNLTPEETRRMVTHLWELRNVDFDYYFFDENCSYRLLELLEVARPGSSLREGFGTRAIPIDTVRAVIAADFVGSISYRPSVATKLEHNVNQLPKDHQVLAWKVAHRIIEPNAPELMDLTATARGNILATAYEYQRYLELENPRTKEASNYSLDLLKTLSKLPVEQTAPPTPTVSPDEGHKTLLFGASGGLHDGTGFADLRLRMSYHDLTDHAAGYLNGAAINIGELRLRKRESDSLQLEQLNFVDINSHAPRTLFLKPITWRVQAGFERLYAKTDDALAAQVHGGAGVTYSLGEHALVYTMAMGRLEHNSVLEHNWAVAAGALAGGVIYFPFGTLQLESNYYHFTDNQQRYQHKLIQNIPLGRNNAVRLSASHQKQVDYHFDEFSLEFRHYF